LREGGAWVWVTGPNLQCGQTGRRANGRRTLWTLSSEL
jgi:hypothetical protein